LFAAYFFASAESSTIAADGLMLYHSAHQGDKRAKLVEAFRNNPRRFFGTTLIGTNICIVVLSAVGAHTLLPEFGGPVL
jgi:Mg2+/Co2+ transporter CorB